MKGEQVRAARELLSMTQQDLARACEVSQPTLRAIEAGTGDPRLSSIDRVGRYLHSRFVVFLGNEGVRLVKNPGPYYRLWGYQVRAARELLSLSQKDLAIACGVSQPTLYSIETETGDPRSSNIEAVVRWLEGRGIVFVKKPGLIGTVPVGASPAAAKPHGEE